jgi:hypothetical protein
MPQGSRHFIPFAADRKRIRDLLGFSDDQSRSVNSRNRPRQRRHQLGAKKKRSTTAKRTSVGGAPVAPFAQTARLVAILSSWQQANFKT